MTLKCVNQIDVSFKLYLSHFKIYSTMILSNSIKTAVLLFMVSVFFMPLNLDAQQDTIYYNMAWKHTTKDSAAFFRPPVKKEGDF